MKMTLISFTFGLVLTASALMGQNAIQGRVLPPAGERQLPPESRIVVVLNRPGTAVYRNAIVREGGRFDFIDLPRGHYQITVRCPGRRENSKSITIYRSIGGMPQQFFIRLGPREQPDVPPGEVVAVELLAVPKAAVRELEAAAGESEKGNSEQAVKHLLKAIEIHPEFPQAYNNLGAQYLKLAQREEALAAFRKSIEIEPQNAMAYRNLGLIYLQDKSYAEAVEMLEISVSQETDHLPSLVSLGRAYFDSGRIDKAAETFERVVALDPEHAIGCFSLGFSYYRLQRHEDAVKALERFLELQPQGRQADIARQILQQLGG